MMGSKLGTLLVRSRQYLRNRSTSASSFKTIGASEEVDEERLGHYLPARFYPVSLGSIFDSRYQVLSKLTYGSLSTFWLSRDIMFVSFCLQVHF